MLFIYFHSQRSSLCFTISLLSWITGHLILQSKSHWNVHLDERLYSYLNIRFNANMFTNYNVITRQPTTTQNINCMVDVPTGWGCLPRKLRCYQSGELQLQRSGNYNIFLGVLQQMPMPVWSIRFIVNINVGCWKLGHVFQSEYRGMTPLFLAATKQL